MYMASAYPPRHFWARPKNTQVSPKLLKKVVFWPKFLSSIKIRKIFFKNLKYVLGYGPIFEKKNVLKKGQKRVKIGVVGFLPYFTLFHTFLPCFPYFTLFWATSWGAATKLGIKGYAARPEGRAAMGW